MSKSKSFAAKLVSDMQAGESPVLPEYTNQVFYAADRGFVAGQAEGRREALEYLKLELEEMKHIQVGSWPMNERASAHLADVRIDTILEIINQLKEGGAK